MVDVKRMLLAIATAAAVVGVSGCAKSFVAPAGMPLDQYAYITAACHQQGEAAGNGVGIASSRARRVSTRLAEDAAAAVVSGIAAAIDSNSTYNQCMEASGAIDAGSLPKTQVAAAALYSPIAQPAPPGWAPVQPQGGAPYLQSSYAPPLNRRAERSQIAASQWLTAERILDESGSDRQKRDLYLVLCGAGDETSCIWAAALSRRSPDRL